MAEIIRFELKYTGPGPTEDMMIEFHQRMVNRMSVSGWKYGPVASVYPHQLHAIDQLRLYLDKYEATHNLDLLADIANFAGMEAMCPSFPDAHDSMTGTLGRFTLAGHVDEGEMAGASVEIRQKTEPRKTSVDYNALR